MSKVERRVRSLVQEDGEMQDALEVVLDRATDGEVRWVDVRDEISSGQWGRLIEKEILVDGDEGFAIADHEEIEEGLTDDDSGSDVETPETTSWTKWDKLAALATVGAFVGYAVSPVRNLIAGAIDIVLGPLLGLVPFYVVIMLIALGTGLYSTLLRAGLMDMEKMSMYQDRMKDIQERRKEAKEQDDDEALDAIQDEQMEAMGDQLGMFKEQFRPMVWIMFLTIPAFLWMFWVIGYRGSESAYPSVATQEIVMPLAGTVTWDTGIVGPMQVWIVWYFLCSMAFTQLVQKSLDIKMSPSSS
ncbi:MAG: putative membrane protein [uncultured archaeon A07HR67]|nr:MAG: putative membrane protein [uncultured archaeon A07HR67]